MVKDKKQQEQQNIRSSAACAVYRIFLLLFLFISGAESAQIFVEESAVISDKGNAITYVAPKNAQISAETENTAGRGILYLSEGAVIHGNIFVSQEACARFAENKTQKQTSKKIAKTVAKVKKREPAGQEKPRPKAKLFTTRPADPQGTVSFAGEDFSAAVMQEQLPHKNHRKPLAASDVFIFIIHCFYVAEDGSGSAPQNSKPFTGCYAHFGIRPPPSTGFYYSMS